MLKNLVKMAVPNPGNVAVGSTITLGAAPTGYQSFLAAFGAGATAFFTLSDGAGRTLGVNKHRSGTSYEFRISSCKRLWKFIWGGVPIGADRDPTCTTYFQACSTG
jgi:hypothetical protein